MIFMRSEYDVALVFIDGFLGYKEIAKQFLAPEMPCISVYQKIRPKGRGIKPLLKNSVEFF